jgi:hypothetical protein
MTLSKHQVKENDRKIPDPKAKQKIDRVGVKSKENK